MALIYGNVDIYLDILKKKKGDDINENNFKDYYLLNALSF